MRSEGNHVAWTNRYELWQTPEFELQLARRFSFDRRAAARTPATRQVSICATAGSSQRNRRTGAHPFHFAPSERLRGRPGRSLPAPAEALRERASAGADRE